MYTCAWALWWGNLRKKQSNSRPHFYRKRSSCWTSACSPFWTSQWKGEDQKLTAFWTVSALLAVSSWIRRHVGHHANILLFFFTNMYCYFDSQPRPRVDNVLDSQCSIGSCFVDSQARGPSSPVSPAKRVAREPSKCTCLHAIHLPDWLPWRIYSLRHAHHITHAHTQLTAAQVLYMAEVVLQTLEKAAAMTCVCKSCSIHTELSAVLSRALASAQELIENLHRDNWMGYTIRVSIFIV